MKYRIVEEVDAYYLDGNILKVEKRYRVEKYTCWLWGWGDESLFDVYPTYEAAENRLNELVDKARTKIVTSTKVLKTVKV